MSPKFSGTLILLSIFCFLEIKSEIDEKVKKALYNIYKKIAIEVEDLTDQHVSPDQVQYFLFTKNNKSNCIKIDPKDPKELINPAASIVFFIHGWTESRKTQWYEDLKNAFLNKQENYYIVQVDWHGPANQLYTTSAWHTKEVGHMIGEFIVGLYKNHSIPEIVKVVHTNVGIFGFVGSCGTIDFYPNGGYQQPGCKIIELWDITNVPAPLFCNHFRSFQLYIEATLNPNALVGTRCTSWAQFEAKLCEKVHVAMGDLKTHETGEFYLATNSEKPFTKI